MPTETKLDRKIEDLGDLWANSFLFVITQLRVQLNGGVECSPSMHRVLQIPSLALGKETKELQVGSDPADDGPIIVEI